MTNALLIKKILKKINYKTYTLSKSIIIEDDEYKWIIPYGDKEYDYYLSAATFDHADLYPDNAACKSRDRICNIQIFPA